MRSIGWLVPAFVLVTVRPVVAQRPVPDSASWDDTVGVSNSRLTGLYATGALEDGGCLLAIREMPDDRVHFRLDCNRGAPSYNEGAAQGTLPIVAGAATYRVAEFEGVCEIRFEFAPRAVHVTQTGSDVECGFGFGVNAEGVYQLKNRHVRAADLEARQPS